MLRAARDGPGSASGRPRGERAYRPDTWRTSRPEVAAHPDCRPSGLAAVLELDDDEQAQLSGRAQDAGRDHPARTVA